jgi:hypothetical protein
MIDRIVSILEWLHETPMADEIRNSVWLFPAFESIHVVAIVFVVGSITRVDLRLMGLIQKHRPVTALSEEMLPYTWAGFAVATLFGLLLWSSKPLVYLGIAYFDVKMVLIILAGLNMLYFQFVTFKKVAEWDYAALPPWSVRLAGTLSLVFWVGVVTCGRFIGFV